MVNDPTSSTPEPTAPAATATPVTTKVRKPLARKAAPAGKTPAAKPARKKAVATTPAKKSTASATAKTATKALVPKKVSKPAIKKPTTTAATTNAVQIKPQKVVRDSFTMTESDSNLLKQCKRDAVLSGRETRKSEVVRAALIQFAALSADKRLAAYNALTPVKTGRPNKKK